MGFCFKCGVEKNKLFDIVSEEGIVNICEDCVQDDKVPIVRRPLEGAFEDTNSKNSVRERLSSIAGINLNEHRKFGEEDDKKYLQDAALKEIVDENLSVGSAESLDVEVDLIRNFHWIVMRARRLKKITLSELAKKIAEPEEVLKMIERGDVSKSNMELIKKLELFFGIMVLTDEARKKNDYDSNEKVSFDRVISQSLTIDDLREMRKKEEADIFEEPVEEVEEVVEDERLEEQEKLEVKEKKVDYSGDLTRKEIDDIIFGRK